MRTLKGKTALVTGAGRGIGKEITLRLADAGAELLLHYGGSRDAAVELQRDIQEEGGTAHLLQADLGDRTGIDQLFRQLETLLAGRRLDILVNNAGIIVRTGIDQLSEAEFDRLFDVNVKAPFFIIQKALPLLSDGGRIINVSSHLSQVPRYAVGAYSMTKAALNSLTVSTAAQLGARGITVNAIGPGATDTDMNKERFSDAQLKATIAGMNALKRVGTVGDIVPLVVFLAGPEAGWITGQYIDVSGGSDILP